MKDNKRIPTSEKEVREKSRSTRVKEDKTPHRLGVYGDDDDDIVRTPPAVSLYVNH